MTKKWIKTSILLSLLLLVISCSSDSGPTDPDLQSHTIVLHLEEGDFLICIKEDTLLVHGPADFPLLWEDGKLWADNGADRMLVRPNQIAVTTEELMLRAQGYYPNVPRILELLADNDEPTLEEWFSAYSQWLDEQSSLEHQIKQHYVDDTETDRTELVAQLEAEVQAHSLVMEESVSTIVLNIDGSPYWTIKLRYKGGVVFDDGSVDFRYIPLSSNYTPPEPSPTEYLLEDALFLENIINEFLAASIIPLGVDISSSIGFYSYD